MLVVEYNVISECFEVVNNRVEGFRQVLKQFEDEKEAQQWCLKARFNYCL